MKAFKKITSVPVVLAQANIDTDQIIPARFLKVTSRAGLGENLFADWRYKSDGRPDPAFVLNTEAAKKSLILVAGDNFGCGSSREHAPWALVDYGFKAVISTRFADIFRNNSLKNGLLPVVVPEALHARLVAGEGGPLEIDLDSLILSLSDGTKQPFEIDGFARYLLLNGFDELDFLLQQDAAVSAYEANLP